MNSGILMKHDILYLMTKKLIQIYISEEETAGVKVGIDGTYPFDPFEKALRMSRHPSVRTIVIHVYK